MLIAKCDELCQSQIAQQSEKFAALAVSAQQYAHIIFTSGSTGLPKGTLGNYGSTYNRIGWMLDELPYQHQESVVHITSMAFIRGIWELLVPLCGGAHLHLVERFKVKDPRLLLAYLQRHQVSRMVCAPSLSKALMELATQNDQGLPLRHWFVSGEPLLQSQANKMLEAFPNLTPAFLYGIHAVEYK